ncbi:MAG: hypothetical protein KDE27_11590 [Planctomycetes bacterium]|nr:hypothetical protein [Planctomycetota bacterium]
MTTAPPISFLETTPRISGVRAGRVLRLQGDSAAVVDYDGNPGGPVRARVSCSVTPRALRQAADAGHTVLLAFEDRDPGRAILFDVVGGTRRRGSTATPAPVAVAASPVAVAPRAAGETFFGRIAEVQGGRALVDFAGNDGPPLPARSTVVLRNLQDEVVLTRVGDELLIVGQVLPAIVVEGRDSAGDLALKCRNLSIEAEGTITIAAGTSRVELDARGSAKTTAAEIVSRARGANRVQGGCVLLN